MVVVTKSKPKTSVKPKSPTKTLVKSPTKTLVKSPSKSVVKSTSKTLVKIPSKTVVKSVNKTLVKSPSKVTIVQNQHSKTLKEFLNNNKYKFLTTGLATAGVIAGIKYFGKSTKKQVIQTAEIVGDRLKTDKELQEIASDIGAKTIIKAFDHYVQKTTEAVTDALYNNPVTGFYNALASVAFPAGVPIEKKEITDKIIVNTAVKVFFDNFNKRPENEIQEIKDFLTNKKNVNSSCFDTSSVPGGIFNACSDEEKQNLIKLIEEISNSQDFKDFLNDKEFQKELSNLQKFEEFLYDNHYGKTINCYSYKVPNLSWRKCSEEQQKNYKPEILECFKLTKGDTSKINQCNFPTNNVFGGK
jgi:hypothetical protein